MKEIRGIPVSSGRTVGKAFRIKRVTEIHGPDNVMENNPSEQEIERFRQACSSVRDRLAPHAADNDIFAAHIEILEDIVERVVAKIAEERIDAVRAVEKTSAEICALFADLDDEYLRSRSDDIVDVCGQISLSLTGNTDNPFLEMPKDSVILADNLLPSDSILIDLSKLAGIALKKGSINSHLAILARSHGIPLVLGIGDVLDNIADGQTVVVDSEHGVVITDPDESLLLEVSQRTQEHREVDLSPAVTRDGVEIAVYANAGSLSDIERAISRGADGIGLLRTEFIFMQSSDFPSEDEQYHIYTACAKACQGKILTIRTLDIGADKQLPYYRMEAEENPVMGLRGIRFSLSAPAIFKAQLRAILRAAVSENIRLMFPMITSMEEYNRACAFLETCKLELGNEKVNFAETLRAGIMIETPASVMLADDFAQKVPFFSVGTNDLTQYMLAVDRENPYSSTACDSFHPAVLKSISNVVETARKYATEVSVCGELASDTRATALLIKSGIYKLSVTGRNIPTIKEQIRKQTIKA